MRIKVITKEKSLTGDKMNKGMEVAGNNMKKVNSCIPLLLP